MPFRSPALSEPAPRVDLDVLAATWEANTRTQEAMVRSMRRIERLIWIEVVSMALVAWVCVSVLVHNLDQQRAMLAAALAAQVAVTDVQLEAETVEAELVESVEPAQVPAVIVAPVTEAVVKKRVAAREKVRKTLRMLGEPELDRPDAARPE